MCVGLMLRLKISANKKCDVETPRRFTYVKMSTVDPNVKRLLLLPTRPDCRKE